jgi:hypothetical protein
MDDQSFDEDSREESNSLKNLKLSTDSIIRESVSDIYNSSHSRNLDRNRLESEYEDLSQNQYRFSEVRDVD